MDTNEKIVSLAVNLYKGNPVGEFSQSDSMETLRKALVAANNGSTKISYILLNNKKYLLSRFAFEIKE